MGATVTERAQPTREPRRSREPFPWFIVVVFGLVTVGVVATSAVRIFRYRVEDTAREQRWRAEHQARLREATEHGGGAIDSPAPAPPPTTPVACAPPAP